MSIKKIHVCDGCGMVLEQTCERYRLALKTDWFWDGVETTSLQENLEFCENCARTVKDALLRIAARIAAREDVN